jgi:AcrR family transcriptional regulator
VAGPAYSRLQVDERRRQLLEAGARVFTERSYDDASMAAVARAAGISKGLLYHYFPSKRDLFVATLEAAAAELQEITQPDPSRPVAEQPL